MTILSGPQTRPVKHRLAAVAFLILVVLVYSTGAEMRGEALDWSASARTALAAGIAWLLLVPVVIAADRQLPIARDVLYPRLLLHVPLSVVVSWAFAYVYYGSSRALGVPVETALLTGSPVSAFHRFNWLVYWAVIGWYVASEYQDQARDRTVRTAELERLLTQSRLDTLRTQLHPHFLFNALNAISAHVESAPRTARWMLEQLGDLLRLALDHAEDQVIPLQRELAFVDRYMKLQKVRYEDRLDVVLDVDPLALQALVPTFILQPLLENAIRHGIATRSAPGQIEIQAWCEGDALHLSVRDDGPGLSVNWDIERQAGVGLSNTRERLKRLYGDRQSFAIAGAVGAGVQVDLRFPLQRAVEPREGAARAAPARGRS
jgi:two-component system, LytTR family, sensor kinase